jgi:2-dehydropantoate 2-reductase
MAHPVGMRADVGEEGDAMRIATMATGGIGGLLAARLTAGGHEVAAIARGPHLDAIRSSGLRVRTPSEDLVARPWKVTDNPAEIGPVDAVLFAVKGHALETAARACVPLIGPQTIVIPFLNGIEAADRLAGIVDPGSVGNGVAYVSATISSPGEVTQTTTAAWFIFAERDSRPSARVDQLRAAFRESGVEARTTQDIDREVWTKFIWFAALSGVTAAGRCRLKDILAYPALTDLFREVARETAILARISGVAVDENVEEKTLALARSLPGELRASTAVDLEAGRPIETHWINGAVARLSEAKGLSAPVNRTITGLLAPYI